MAETLTGRCQCGAVRYRITERPITLYCCHCTDCRAQSSSAFGMSLLVDAKALEVSGDLATHIAGDAGQKLCRFCPACGTRIVHEGGDVVSIKAGTLDQIGALKPAGHIWTRSALLWVVLDGLTYETEPDDEFAALIAAFREN